MNKIIIGLGFGDEGKGLVVDWLSSLSPNSLVVRFSGGHQCGHTVFTDTISHIFSNFGSGSLRGIPTYWSKYCTVEPVGLMRELTLLLEQIKNTDVKSPLLMIDKNCPVTTPYDIKRNRLEEDERYIKHGSCGVGFGATIEREENNYSLKFLDLFYPSILKEKLRLIETKYYNYQYEDKKHITTFIDCCYRLVDSSYIKKVLGLPELENYIFEGSQGLLLDQNFGFFPNVTRSNTGMKNAIELLQSTDFEIYLVTRAYQTRHGNGFMTNNHISHNILNNPLETNQEHEYQGKFKKSLLDVSLLEYALEKDEYIKKSCHKKLVITCLDHIVNEYRFTYKGNIIACSNENEFINKITYILNINEVFISHSNNSQQIIRRYNE